MPPLSFGLRHAPDGRVVPWDPTLLTLVFDGTAAPILYLGEALPGTAITAADWRITRFDTTVGVLQTWADGDSIFDNVWADRASLSYS